MITIAHAAIKLTEHPYTVFVGKHHEECYKKYNTKNPKADQGFVTNTGKFVNRSTAAVIAVNAGQIERVPRELFSEDFWSPMYAGKYDYEPETGYVLKEVKDDS